MIERIANAFGIKVPEQPDLFAAGAAVAAVVIAALAGWAIGRWLGPRLASLWERRSGVRTEGMGPRLCSLVRNGTIWLLVAIALRAHPWPPLASLIIGLAAATAAALVVVNLMRGLRLARLVAWVAGAVTFVAILADAVGGLDPMMETLDGVAVMAGTRRVSLLNVLQIGISLAVLYLIVRLANRILGHSVRHAQGLDPAQRLLVQKLAGVAIVVIAFVVALNLAGIDLTALAVFGGAFGLAVGFGLQKTVGNLFAGIILLMDRSIKPGDVIVVGESFGQVTKIGVRAVSVVTRDGKEHLIPNENLMTQEVENWSYSSKDVRVHIPVGISYDCDLALAQRLMVEAAQASERVLKVPRPNVWLRRFGDSSIDHDILVWITDPEAGVGNVQSEILNRLWVLFKENGIEIPYPQHDVRVKEWPGAAPPGLGARSEPEQGA
ncbi:MAG TPA: mechanosensitive ion channel domain-containing protein [Allosphingosinicella sp.]|jgi:small-conductance mechanosensitive channel